MTSEEKMREEFEEAMRAKGYKQFSRKGEHYQYDDIDALWQGFKLGRESLVIELPSAPVPTSKDGTYTIAQSAYHQGQMSVEKSIHAAGVKTR